MIKTVAGLVKEHANTYQSDSSQDYSKLTPSPTFLSLVSFLKDLFSQLTHSLGLDDESRVFLGLVIFKEKLMLTLLMRALEVLRDILIILPLTTKQLEDPQNAAKYKQYSGD